MSDHYSYVSAKALWSCDCCGATRMNDGRPSGAPRVVVLRDEVHRIVVARKYACSEACEAALLLGAQDGPR